MHIGKLIEEEVKRQGLTPNQFAGLISTSRTNVYNYFKKQENIDLEMLARISKVLHRNFFAEMAAEMAQKLGTATPPATMANLKLKTLNPVFSNKTDGSSIVSTVWAKDREELKFLLKEYFESDHRIPLLILETGYTFGAREVVKQMANEVFRGCGSAPCPKMIDVNKVMLMPEKVLIDYIDKNTFDSVGESDRRVSEICLIQKDVTKKFVCIIHTDPPVDVIGNKEMVSFEQWGSMMGVVMARNKNCFITEYRWGRASLLSWAEDARMHEFVLNYIKHHPAPKDSPLDFHLIHAYVPVNKKLLGIPALVKDSDYPTAYGYRQNEWEYVSDFIREKRDIKEEYRLRGLIQDVIDFNENPMS